MSMIDFIIDDEKNIELFHKIKSLAPSNYLINFNNYKIEFNSIDTSSFSHYDSISVDKKDDYRLLIYREYNQDENEISTDKYSIRYDSSYEKVEAFSYFSVDELSRYLEKVYNLIVEIEEKSNESIMTKEKIQSIKENKKRVFEL